MTLCRPFMGRLFLLDEFVPRFDDEAVDGDGERGNVFFVVECGGGFICAHAAVL